MQFFAIAIHVLILVNASTNSPEVQAIPNGYMKYSACETWTENMRSAGPHTIDKVTGKKVLAEYFVCTPADLESDQRRLQRVIDKYKVKGG